jgi:hypothetical protein
MDLQLPSGFHNHVLRIVQGIDNHLEIFRELSDSAGGHKYVLESYVAELYGLVAHAGILSLLMRIDPHTVYRVTPVLKEDSFRPKYMQCFNNANMEAEDPRDRKDWTGIPPGEIHMRKDDKPVTQIIVMDGITAYRLGGWEKSESKVWDVKYDDKNYDHKRGIRSQLLAHGWVFCRWGRPRKFEGGKEIKNPKIHGSAWKDGGFVEFEDVEGVRRPKKSKASSKGNTTKKEKAKVV